MKLRNVVHAPAHLLDDAFPQLSANERQSPPDLALGETMVALEGHLDADTLRPGWLGESLDVGYAISVLHPRALEPSVIRE